jgi:hypothetical protein
VIIQGIHIQHIRLEEDEGKNQPKEQLEKVGLKPTQGEMAEAKMP